MVRFHLPAIEDDGADREVGFGILFFDKTAYILSETILSSPGCICPAFTRIAVDAGLAVLIFRASMATAMRGLLRPSSSAASSAVICNSKGSQEMISTGV